MHRVLLLLLVTSFAGCGGSSNEASAPGAPSTTLAPTRTESATLQPPSAVVLPDDDAQAEAWVREYLDVYEEAYRTCGGYVDISSPTYSAANISGVDTARTILTERARLTSERAAWVAFFGCQDGISDYPYPIPELAYLQRNP